MTTSNDPDQIRAEIERTRSSLSSNVNALAHEAAEHDGQTQGRVRSPGCGMGSAQDSTSTISDSAQSAMSSATEIAQSAPTAVRKQAQGNLSQPDSSPSVPG